MSQEIKICTSASGSFGGGLSASDTIQSCNKIEGACIVKTGGNSSQFLKADGSVDSTGYTTCTGTLVPANIAGFTCCTGTVVAGDIAGLTDCLGTVTCVSTGPYLTGGVSTNGEIGINSECAAAWDAAVAGGGTISGVTATALLSGGGVSGCVNIGIDSGALDYLNQSACLGIDCVGTVTCVNVSDGLESTGGNTPTLGIATACNTKWDQSSCAGIDCTGTLVASDLNGLDQSSCPGIDCVGTVEGVTTTGDYLTGGGTTGCFNVGLDSACASKWDNASAGSVSSVTGSGGIVSSGGTTPNVCIDSACNTKWDQSGCAGINCTGTLVPANIAGFTCCTGTLVASDIAGLTDCIGTVVASDIATLTDCTGTVEGVTTTGSYLTGGGTTGCFNVGLDSACAQKWNNAASGGVQSLTTSGGITDSGTATDPNICIDGACNTKWDQSGCSGINKVGTVTGSTAGALLSTNNNSTCIQFGINSGALNYLDQSSCAGLNCTGTVVAGDISGFTSCTGTLNSSGVISANDFVKFDALGCLIGRNCSETRSDLGINTAAGCTAASLDQSSCAGLNCTGTVTSGDISGFTGCTGTTTPSNTQTFTNKSGSNSQWTNDEGYTDCNGTVTGSTAGPLLSTNNNSQCIQFGINAGALTPYDQSSCAGLNCTGTVVAADIGSFTCCLGDVTGIDAGTAITVTDGTTATPQVAVTSTCNIAWNSAKSIADGLATCAGIACTGDITDVSTGPYLTGGGASGAVEVGIDSACASKWDTAAAGDISEVVAGTNLTGGGTSGCVTINMATGGAGAGTYGNTSNQTKIDTITLDAYGRVTAVATGDTGDILGVTAGDGLSGGGASGTITVGLDATTAAGLNQSACPGLNCVGTVVAGDISGFTSCEGTVTSVGGTNGITSTGGTAPTLCITSTCQAKFDQSTCAGINCVGTVVASDLDDLDQSACTGLDCTGTLNSSGLLSNNDFAKFDALGCLIGRNCSETRSDLGINTAANCTASSLDQSSCPGLNCVGTVTSGDISGFTGCLGTTTPSNVQTFTNKSGSNSQWTNDENYTSCTGTVVAGDISSFTSCTGTVTGVAGTSGITSTGGTSPTLCITSTCQTKFDQSACPGLNCTGTITASSGNLLTNKTGCISQWTNDSGYTTCNGDITGVTAGDGITGGATSGTASVAVDSTVVRTSGTQTVGGSKTFSSSACFSTGTTALPGITFSADPNTGLTTGNDILCFVAGGASRGHATSAGITSLSNLYTAPGGMFRNFSGRWHGTTGTTGCGFRFENTADAVVLDISSTGDTCTYGSLSAQEAVIGECIVKRGGTSSQFLKADGSVDSNGYTTCTGTVVAADIVGFTECTGTVVASDIAGFTDCTGTVTSVTGTNGIESTGGTTPILCITSQCQTKFNQSTCPGLNCVGTVVAGDISGFTGCTGTTTPSNTQTFTNKSGNISQWTNNSGYTTCTGTVVAGDISSFTSCTGTLNSTGLLSNNDFAKFDSLGCLVGRNCSETRSDLGINTAAGCTAASLDQSSCPGIDCVGTITASSGNLLTNKTGCISQWTNDSGYTTCTGNLCGSTAQCIFDGDNNFCIGTNAGDSFTSGSNNTLIGKCAGRCITTGAHNVSIGSRAGEKNCIKSYNTVIGFQAGFCGQGCGNTAIGQQAMQNSSADNAIAIGKCTLYSASGNSNTAIGAQALQNMSTGQNNFGLGGIAGFSMSTGSSNVFIGDQAHRYASSGDNNIAIGKYAGRCHASGCKTGGSNSIYIGADARASGACPGNEIVIGCGAIGCGSNTAMIGNASVTVVCSNGTFSTVSDRRDKTCICDLELGLEFIGDLKPKTFNMITDRNDPAGSISCKRHGFIAQDVIALEGDDNVIINNDNLDRLGYNADHIVPILVKAVQELKAEVEALKG